MTRPRWLGAAAWLACAAYLALIWNLSSFAVEFELMNDVPMRDKGVHFVEYGTLAGLLLVALGQSVAVHPLRLALTAVWLTVCAGAADELHQAFVFGRSGELPDLVADAVGALCAAVIFGALVLARRRAQA